MERLTIEKPAGEMSMTELAHNANYAKDGEAWYRDYDQDISLRNFMRKTMKGFGEKRYLEDDELDFELIDNLQYNPVSNIDGLIALLYRSMWAAADLRENLKDYEDTGLTPEQIMEINRMYTEKCQEVTELRNQSCNGCKYEDCSDFDEGGENCNHCSRAYSDEFEAKLAEVEEKNEHRR